MNTEQRQRIGALTAKVRDLRNEHNKAKNDLDAEILKILSEPILEATKTEKPTEQQFNGLPWQPKEGMKGSYEQAENDNSENFRSVQQYVKSLSGFCHLHGFKVFFHYKDEKLIDRKK